MFKYVFKEVEPEGSCSENYFDTDIFSESSGNYNNTLFILYVDHRNLYGINNKEAKNIFENIHYLFNDFEYVKKGAYNDDGKLYTFKQAMEENGIKYNSVKCKKLKDLYMQYDYSGCPIYDFDILACWLSIMTNKTWKAIEIYGYCQGDYATVIYCTEAYTKEHATNYGEIFLGCCKEFMLVDLDENGQEIEETSCCGFYVADNEIHHDEDYKTVLCNYEGLKPEETKVLLISGQTVKTEYTYEEI